MRADILGYFAKRLIALGCPQTADEDQRLVAFARLFGIPVEGFSLDCLRSFCLGNLQSSTRVLAMHFQTLRVLCSEQTSYNGLQWLMNGRFPAIFVYGHSGSPEVNCSLADLTRGEISGVRSSDIRKTRYTLSHELKELCAQLTGQSIAADTEESVSWFEVRSDSSSVEVIIAANERPVFVRWKTPACQVYLLAGCMPDINKKLNKHPGWEGESIRLIPPLILLRQCFPENCWHNPKSTAWIVVDDPLLTETYGFFDLPALQNSMQRLRYGTSVAFIPWNSWRTSRRKASRFLDGNANLAICIHGCDHTGSEFASGSGEMLYAKAVLGKQRMEQQRQRVGVDFEDVMVFPEGKFSKAAVPALRSANYLAIVNSACFPWDSAPDDLKVEDFLWPAVTRFDGFPIFQRRYPRNLSEFAINLFLGKPAIVVEHHEYFRDGCKALEHFVSGLREIDPKLSWPGLSAQLMRTHLRRRSDGNSLEVRFFTRRFQFECGEGDSGVYQFSKHEPDSSIVERVVVNGKSVPFGFEDEFLRLDVEVRPGQLHHIEILDRVPPPPPVYSFGVIYNAGVLFRRALSEFRDNTLSHHPGLLKVTKKIAKAAKMTG